MHLIIKQLSKNNKGTKAATEGQLDMHKHEFDLGLIVAKGINQNQAQLY